MQPAMQSTPCYASVLNDIPQATQHLIILQDQDSAIAQQLLLQYQSVTALECLAARHQQFDADLKKELTDILEDLHTGLHVVVCGDEVFLWHSAQHLLAHGLILDEMQMIKTATTAKQIYCVHCFHLFSSSADEYCDCPQCATHLLIRSHFSERLGAYMGVCANAEELKGDQP